MEATAKPTPAALATVPAQPIGQPADAKAAIAAALEALDKNGPYRMTITVSGDAGGPVTIEVVPPDRSRYSGSVDGKPVEVINIGTAAYVLDPDGTWQTSTTTDSSAATLLIDPAALNSLTDVEVLPSQTINGALTTVYSFVDATSPEVKATLWVSQDKGRPVQMQTTSTDETVLYVIEYDAAIKVEAPVK
jgi:outer membrane lipoprotein-sorting protein